MILLFASFKISFKPLSLANHTRIGWGFSWVPWNTQITDWSITALNEFTSTKRPPLVGKQEHANVSRPCRKKGAAASCQPVLLTVLFMFEKLKRGSPRRYPRRWWSRHTAAAAIQSGKHLGVFVVKRAQRCQSLCRVKEGKKDGSVFHLESVCAFSACAQWMIKGAYEKRQTAADALLGGPASTWHVKPAWDYFFAFVSNLFFFLKCFLIWSWTDIWGC